MGWWSISDSVDMVNGDTPADYMGEAIEKIIKAYESEWDRKPYKEELQAVFNFCRNPHDLKSGVENSGAENSGTIAGFQRMGEGK